jgi:hypothetical protein
MRGRLEGWKVGSIVLGMVLSNVPTVQLFAQVGHDPNSSPYRDIPWRKGPVFFAGYLSGDRGEADAGVTNAQTEGVRWEMNAGKTMLFVFSGAYLMGDRYIINPYVNLLNPDRKTGPYPSNIGTAEIALQLKLTGNKSWHRLAPYVGTGIGLAFDIDSPGDTTKSQYTFGTKFTIDFMGGVRLYFPKHLMLNADGRLLWWRLKYPASFHTQAPDGSRVIPIFQDLTDWTLHPWVSVGVGWNF